MLHVKRILQGVAVLLFGGTPDCRVYKEPAFVRHWVPGAWHHDRRGWFFIAGHWR